MIINSLTDIKDQIGKIKNPILLYSGGLDSSFLATYLKKEFNLSPILLRIDISQTDLSYISIIDELGLEQITLDLNHEFLNNYALKALHNGGIYGRSHFLSASLSRPLFAKSAVNESILHESNCILHCAVPTQNSLRRFNRSLKDLGFLGFFGSPFCLKDISRNDKIEYLKSHNIYVDNNRNFSMDTNLYCREFEAGSLEEISSFEVPEENFIWTKQLAEETQSETLTITITNGIPTHINNQKKQLIDIFNYLNKEVGKYKIGRQISLEEGPISKVVEVRECPAAYILSKSFDDLLTLKYPRSLIENKIKLDQRWATLACEGHWFSKEKEAIEAYNQSIFHNISGHVIYNLSLGTPTLSGVKDLKSLNATEKVAA